MVPVAAIKLDIFPRGLVSNANYTFNISNAMDALGVEGHGVMPGTSRDLRVLSKLCTQA